MRPPSFDGGRDSSKPAFAAPGILNQAKPMQLVLPGPVTGIQPNVMASNDVNQCMFFLFLFLFSFFFLLFLFAAQPVLALYCGLFHPSPALLLSLPAYSCSRWRRCGHPTRHPARTLHLVFLVSHNRSKICLSTPLPVFILCTHSGSLQQGDSFCGLRDRRGRFDLSAALAVSRCSSLSSRYPRSPVVFGKRL